MLVNLHYSAVVHLGWLKAGTPASVLLPFHIFTTDTQMLEDTPAQYKARVQEHAALRPAHSRGHLFVTR
jgi:hypothetical protein